MQQACQFLTRRKIKRKTGRFVLPDTVRICPAVRKKENKKRSPDFGASFFHTHIARCEALCHFSEPHIGNTDWTVSCYSDNTLCLQRG